MRISYAPTIALTEFVKKELQRVVKFNYSSIIIVFQLLYLSKQCFYHRSVRPINYSSIYDYACMWEVKTARHDKVR